MTRALATIEDCAQQGNHSHSGKGPSKEGGHGGPNGQAALIMRGTFEHALQLGSTFSAALGLALVGLDTSSLAAWEANIAASDCGADLTSACACACRVHQRRAWDAVR